MAIIEIIGLGGFLRISWGGQVLIGWGWLRLGVLAKPARTFLEIPGIIEIPGDFWKFWRSLKIPRILGIWGISLGGGIEGD
jgi:hypothetical protein